MTTAAQRLWLTALAVVILCGAIFSIRLSEPTTHNFDEFHYVPAAKEFIEMNINRNWEHPPLGKFFIAASILIFGDNAIGWRASNVFFGALTMGMIFLWAFRLFGTPGDDRASYRAGGLATLLVLFGNFQLVQSRIGTLDAPSAFFAVLAGWAVTELWRGPRETGSRWFWIAGLALGLGAAVKWFGFMLWAAVGLWAFFRFRRDRVRVLLALLVLPVLVYSVTFLPLIATKKEPMVLTDFFGHHKRMWDGMRSVGIASHGYSSSWWSWPLMIRPIWYHYQRSADQHSFRGVLLLANALLFWAAPIFFGYLVWLWRRAKKGSELRQRFAAPLFLWVALYLLWALVPRASGFYYYYYPASFPYLLLVTGLLLEAEKQFRTRTITYAVVCASGLLSLWYYPVLSGAFEVPTSLSGWWMWFNRWI